MKLSQGISGLSLLDEELDEKQNLFWQLDNVAE